uniref:Guanylate cyclase n=1 Tax=Globodera rostochiensis TaxID=31243 RepID=A0A914HY59_GLORO
MPSFSSCPSPSKIGTLPFARRRLTISFRQCQKLSRNWELSTSSAFFPFVPMFVSVLSFLLMFGPSLHQSIDGTSSQLLPTNGTSTGANSSLPAAGFLLPPVQLKIGLLFPNGSQRLRMLFGFGQSAPAVTLALERARQEQLIDNINFTYTWRMSDCFQPWAVGYANQLILTETVDVVIGPPCVSSAIAAGYVATFYNTPIYLWGATVSPALTNATVFPTVNNMNVNSDKLAMAVQSVLVQFNWTEVSFVYIPDYERMVCNSVQQSFSSLVNVSNLTIVFQHQMESNTDSMKSTLRSLRNRSRIVVGCFDVEVDRRNFLLSIFDSGLAASNEFVFIIGALRNQGMLQQVSTGSDGSIKYDNIWVDKNNPSDGRDADALAATKHVIVIDLENQSSAQINEFSRNLTAKFGSFPFFCNGSCMGGPTEQSPSQYARSLFDTTYAYFRALNHTMEQTKSASKDLFRNGSYLNDKNAGSSFQGETGMIRLDSDGNRQPSFYVTMLNALNVPTVTMNVNFSDGELKIEQRYASDAALWVNWGGIRPLTTPLCGYNGTQCGQDVTMYILIGGLLVLVLLIAALLGVGYALREKMREKERLTRECLIPFAELRNLKELRSSEELKADTEKSMRSMHSSQSGSTKLTVGSHKALETVNYAFFVYNREIVLGVKYHVRVRIQSEDLTYLRKLRQLDHDNLNKFYGVCTDAPLLYGIWKHCQRGTLKELIEKEQYVGDNFVMFALMRDIASGLIAIHQSFVGAHGLLSSESCLINDRWQVKISDFGLNIIRESQPMPKKNLLWTAPELLRENNRTGTKEGDVFSFAVICVEMLNRETVWNGVERDDDVDEILYRLKRTNNTIPHRPQLRPREETNQSLLHLVRDCWSEVPSERPRMDMVRTMLKQMVQDGNQNLMDYVFGMLEQYASSLEQEVEERTKELVEEKRKSDILLYRMLPRQVADKLKLGEAVEPESFQMATIFFSDVVSFTTLAGKCTPLQVVNLLNGLYTAFDGIIDTHDCYKVETIGDGYLVCSGIPKRNGDQHAKEIAELSFAFLRTVRDFRVDHLPSERVNLRIGFHSGPAVAGVVGLTMPRYCLFGDSVNTASRMESNGKSGKVHISASANRFLTGVGGGYVTEPRGEVIIKGKGVMETFWLLGRIGEVHLPEGSAEMAPAAEG